MCETAIVGGVPSRQPSGSVTFLFTDVEGSTRLWAAHTAVMERALARHDDLLRAAITAEDGYVFSIAGDSFGAAFASPEAAVSAATRAQIALHAEEWEGLPDGLRVRMGLHLGTTQERAGNYFGPVVNLAARVMSAAWGGQILCTAAIAERVAAPMPPLGDHHLRDVEGTVTLHQVLAPGVPEDFPPPRTLDATPTTLPAQRASFVGRGPDVATVRRLLFDRRLVTLTGPGGTGKTRLAIEIAGREQPHHPGGTFFADLASLEDGDHLAATVARACLISLDASRPTVDQLTDALASRNALVVLDNCEHVLDAVAEVADRVLASCPEVVLLATSREPLELAGEHLYVVSPLDTGRGSEAAELFVERATAAGGDALDAADPTVAELCSRLDGLPLAIELAAARARTSTPAETIERLSRHLDVLSGTRRRGPDRHHTLRATIAWSYDLLEAPERAFFDRLSVFAGSFDVTAAASVAGADVDAADAADRLHDLVSKSMVDLQSGRDGQPALPVVDQLPRLRGRAAPYPPRLRRRGPRAHRSLPAPPGRDPRMAERRARPVGRARTRARQPAARGRPRVERGRTRAARGRRARPRRWRSSSRTSGCSTMPAGGATRHSRPSSSLRVGAGCSSRSRTSKPARTASATTCRSRARRCST